MGFKSAKRWFPVAELGAYARVSWRHLWLRGELFCQSRDLVGDLRFSLWFAASLLGLALIFHADVLGFAFMEWWVPGGASGVGLPGDSYAVRREQFASIYWLLMILLALISMVFVVNTIKTMQDRQGDVQGEWGATRMEAERERLLALGREREGRACG